MTNEVTEQDKQKAEAVKQRIEFNLRKLVINVSSVIRQPRQDADTQTDPMTEPPSLSLNFKSPILAKLS